MSQESATQNEKQKIQQSISEQDGNILISNGKCFSCKGLQTLKVVKATRTPRNKSNLQVTGQCQTCGKNVSTLVAGNSLLVKFIAEDNNNNSV
jgi:hypothetical protein